MSENQEVVSTEQVINNQVYKSIDYSGFFERLFARWIDFFIEAVVGFLVYRKFGLSAAFITAFIFDLTHRVVMTYFLGGTLGKLIFGVRVISRCSDRLSIWQVLIREFSKWISHLILDIGFLFVMFSRRKRALHDIMACTAVTSGGRREAEYARKVYSERSEKWSPIIPGAVTAVLAVSILIAAASGFSYILNNMGMIGFTLDNSSAIGQYSYKIPDLGSGTAGLNKRIIQIGDVNGSGNYQIFREYIKDGKPAIISMRSSGSDFLDGEPIGTFDKPIIQYRLADLDGDKKDELAVLFEDKSIKFYNLDGGMTEVGAIGPLEYKQINAFIKGKPQGSNSYSLYTIGDGNKLSVISFKDQKFQEQKFELPGQNNITDLGCGTFSGKYYLTALCSGGNIVFYSFDGSKYTEAKNVSVPARGSLSMAANDINMDGKSEIIISSTGEGKGNAPSIAAYTVSGSTMKLVWNGGKQYRYRNSNMSLMMDDGMALNGKFRAYTVFRQDSQGTGTFTLLVFESDKILMKANDILRAIAIF